MRVEEIGLPSALEISTGASTWKPRRRPYCISISAVPAPPWPKRKFSPITTASAPTGGETSISAKRSARIRENAFVNGTTSSSSTPRRSMSWVFSPMCVRTAGRSSGRRTAIGWGSNVSAIALRRRSRAISIARPMIAWWPTCTPSNVPIATTRRCPPSGRSPNEPKRLTAGPPAPGRRAARRRRRVARPRRAARRAPARPARSRRRASPRQRPWATSSAPSASSSRRGRCGSAAQRGDARPRGPPRPAARRRPPTCSPTAVRRSAVR